MEPSTKIIDTVQNTYLQLALEAFLNYPNLIFFLAVGPPSIPRFILATNFVIRCTFKSFCIPNYLFFPLTHLLEKLKLTFPIFISQILILM